MMNFDEYQDEMVKRNVKKAQKKAAKKAKKKAMVKASKKSAKKGKQAEMDFALGKLKQLDAVANEPRQDTLAKREEATSPVDDRILGYDKDTGKPIYKPFNNEEKAQFQSRIKNEKGNIWRMCLGDAQKIKDFCEANEKDESNAAIRFARRDALKYAIKELNGSVIPF